MRSKISAMRGLWRNGHGGMALARAKKKNGFSLASHPVVSENTFCKINKCIPFVYTLKKSTDSFLLKS